MNKMRRTMLFCPASIPKHLFTAMIYKPDCILFDLEDSVSIDDKIGARDLLVEALKVVDYKECQVFARINSLNSKFGRDDVNELVRAGLRNIRLPMCETAKDINELVDLLNHVENENKIETGSVKIQCAIETPLGVENVLSILQVSDRIQSVSFGAEDFTMQLGVNRSKDGIEISYARSKIVLASKIVGIDAIDTVYPDYNNHEGFNDEVHHSIQLGFTGKACIHPSQIDLVHHAFKPTDEAYNKATKIIEAAEKASITSGGVIQVDNSMIDIPVIEKAKKVIQMYNI